MPKSGKRKTRRGGRKFHIQQLHKSLYQPALHSEYVGIPSLPIVREQVILRNPVELQSASRTSLVPQVPLVQPVCASEEEIPFRVAETLLPWTTTPIDSPQSEHEARCHPSDPRRFTWWPEAVKEKIQTLFGEL